MCDDALAKSKSILLFLPIVNPAPSHFGCVCVCALEIPIGILLLTTVVTEQNWALNQIIDAHDCSHWCVYECAVMC